MEKKIQSTTPNKGIIIITNCKLHVYFVDVIEVYILSSVEWK